MSADQLVPFDKDRGPGLTNVTERPAIPGSPSIVPTFNNCHHAEILRDYDVATATVFSMYFLFGIVYCLFGYRCFKAVMFLTGFIFASFIIYLICIQDKNMMPAYGNAVVSLSAGLLFGLITMLVQYMGLIVTGFHTGILIAFASLTLSDLLYHTPTLLTTCFSLLISGTFFCSLTLRFKKGLTVIGTSLYGAAILACSTDYFFENLAMLKYIWSRITIAKKSKGSGTSASWMFHPYSATAPDKSITRLNNDQSTCWISWMILSFWPSMFVLGLIIQFAITGRGLHHQQSIPMKHRQPNGSSVHRMRVRAREQRGDPHQKKYRYLYQVRTAHGDVISQNYVQALQRKVVGTGMYGGMTGGESSTLQSDATHLTILPPDQQHHHHYRHDDEEDHLRRQDDFNVQHSSRSHMHNYR